MLEMYLTDEQRYALLTLLEKLTPTKVAQLVGKDQAPDALQALQEIENVVKDAEGLLGL